jgi:hypothetical protein
MLLLYEAKSYQKNNINKLFLDPESKVYQKENNGKLSLQEAFIVIHFYNFGLGLG